LRQPPESVLARALGSSETNPADGFGYFQIAILPARAEAAITSRTVNEASKRGSCTTAATRTPLRTDTAPSSADSTPLRIESSVDLTSAIGANDA